MSNTIAHIMVAKKILEKNKNCIENMEAYYLGSIAPDTISSKENASREDKKIVHLRQGISDLDWLKAEQMGLFNERITSFIYKYIVLEKNESQKSFNIGYLVHLLTDKWNHKTIRQIMLKYANTINVMEKDKAFFEMMISDLGALDKYLLDTYSDVKDIFNHICNNEIKYSLNDYIEKEYIVKSIDWWINVYIPQLKWLSLKYLQISDIEYFITKSSDEISKELREKNIF